MHAAPVSQTERLASLHFFEASDLLPIKSLPLNARSSIPIIDEKVCSSLSSTSTRKQTPTQQRTSLLQSIHAKRLFWHNTSKKPRKESRNMEEEWRRLKPIALLFRSLRRRLWAVRAAVDDQVNTFLVLLVTSELHSLSPRDASFGSELREQQRVPGWSGTHAPIGLDPN